MEEIWKSHPDFENYEFSNFGNFKNTKTGQLLKNSISEQGYVVTFLFSKSKQKRVKVRLHRIVGELFIPKPQDPNKNTINHIDGVKTNNYYLNLEWVTNQENIKHSIDTNLRKRSWAQKLTEEQVKEIRELYNETNITISQIVKKYNVNEHSIRALLKYNTYPNVDPDKKYHYKINQTNNTQFLLDKKINAKIIPIELINSVLYDFVNLGLNTKELKTKYKISSDKILTIFKNPIPKPTLNNNETLLPLTNHISITNTGKVFVNNIHKKITTTTINGKLIKLKKLIAEKYIPNPNNFCCVNFKDNNKNNLAITNLEWFDPNQPNKYKQNIIDDYLNTKLNKSQLAEKYNTSKNTITRILKNYPHKKREKKEKIYTYIKKPKRQHLCKTCGENNPEKFYKKSKGSCKSCENKKCTTRKFLTKNFPKKIF